MNRIYKVIWSKTKNCYVVASEIAKRHTKGSVTGSTLVRGVLAGAVLLSLTAGVCAPAWAGLSFYDNGSWGYGFENRGGSGNYIISIGDYNAASNSYSNSVGIGFAGGVNGSNAVSVGIYATASSSATALGYYARAENDGAIAMGNNARVRGNLWWVGGYWDNGQYINMDNKLVASNSIAIGSGTRAEAMDTTTVGRASRALMRNATAYGNNAHANSVNSIAIGNKSIAGLSSHIFTSDDPTNPNIILEDPQSALDHGKADVEHPGIQDDSAIAVGNRATAINRYATAVGVSSYADGMHSVAVGDSNRATGKYSTALGAGYSIYEIKDANGITEPDGLNTENKRTYKRIGANQAAGDFSTAVGYNNKTASQKTSAFGIENDIAGADSLGIGSENKVGTFDYIKDDDEKDTPLVAQKEKDVTGYAVGSANIIMGVKDKEEQINEQFAGAFGHMNMVSGKNGYALGNDNKTTSNDSIAVGSGNEIGELNSEKVKYKEIQLVKDEETGEFKGVEVEVEKDRYKGDEQATNAMAFGKNNKIHGKQGIAIGNNNIVSGNKGIAIGNPDDSNKDNPVNNTVSGEQSIAVGTGLTVSGDRSGAFGDPGKLDGDDAYMIGNNNEITDASKQSFILGNNVKTTLPNTVVVGHHDEDNTHQFGKDSVSLGTNAIARVDTAVALGSDSIASEGPNDTGGFNVLTGKDDYKGTEKDQQAWVSTRGSVSVGTEDGTVTRQIKNVAAGKLDTDAVNVAQLKLAGVEIVAGDNVEVIKDTSSGHAVYTIHSLNAIVAAGDNITVDGKPGDAAGNNGKTTDPDGNPITSNTNAGGAGNNGTAASAGGTATPSKDPIEPEENHHTTTYKISTEKAVVEGDEDSGIEVTSTTDKDKNITTYTVKSTTHYSISNEAGDKSVVNNYTITGTNGDTLEFEDTNTTYNFSEDRKIKGTVASTMTVKDSDGNKFEFQDTHNGLTGDTYEVDYKDGKGTVTIKDKDGNEATITGIRDTAAINNLDNKIYNLDNKIEKVGAGAAALAGLHPLDFDPDEKWDFAAALGSYKSEQAVAIGAFYRPNEDTMFSIGGTVGNGNNMVNVGVSWKFGQKNRISANRISSAKEIIELRKNQENVHSFLADAVAGNQLDLSKIQLFPDVEENHWAYDYVATMAGNGILEGYPDGYFKGNRNMTRYEMAAVLYRLMQNGARLSDKALTEFAPELDRIRVDTITHHKDGTPHIQRVRTIKERVEEKADPAQVADDKAAKEKLAQEKKAAVQAEKERLAQEKAEAKAEKERLAQEKKAEKQAAKEKAAQEKAAAKAAKAKAAE